MYSVVKSIRKFKDPKTGAAIFARHRRRRPDLGINIFLRLFRNHPEEHELSHITIVIIIRCGCGGVTLPYPRYPASTSHPTTPPPSPPPMLPNPPPHNRSPALLNMPHTVDDNNQLVSAPRAFLRPPYGIPAPQEPRPHGHPCTRSPSQALAQALHDSPDNRSCAPGTRVRESIETGWVAGLLPARYGTDRIGIGEEAFRAAMDHSPAPRRWVTTAVSSSTMMFFREGWVVHEAPGGMVCTL